MSKTKDMSDFLLLCLDLNDEHCSVLLTVLVLLLLALGPILKNDIENVAGKPSMTGTDFLQSHISPFSKLDLQDTHCLLDARRIDEEGISEEKEG